jgi:hypothetical protein
MSVSPDWLRAAEALLAALPERPDDAGPEEERLDWRLQEELTTFVTAAKLKAKGVKAKDRRGWPRVLSDVPISAWWTQEQLAELIGRDVRTLRRWADRGLPSFGDGAALRYPIPHALAWASAYGTIRATRRCRIRFLPLEVALGEHRRTGAYITAGRRLRVQD